MPVASSSSSAQRWCAPPLPALALVTLETTLSNISCGITDTAGASLFSDCTSLSFAASIDPGETAFLRATLAYHYTDDGLMLPSPRQFQINSLGSNSVVTFNEAAGLYVNSNLCDGRFCALPPHVRAEGTHFTPLILGLNDKPDDITGSRTLTLSASWSADFPDGYNFSGQVGYFRNGTFVNSVPEPATWALIPRA